MQLAPTLQYDLSVAVSFVDHQVGYSEYGCADVQNQQNPFVCGLVQSFYLNNQHQWFPELTSLLYVFYHRQEERP